MSPILVACVHLLQITLYKHVSSSPALATLSLRALPLAQLLFVLLFVAFSLIGNPLTIAPDIIPCIGPFFSGLAGCFVFAVSFFAALSLSITVTALAWLAYRPILGALLLAVAVAVAVPIFIIKSKAKGSGVAQF